jgi:hypothetical protein
MSGEYTRALQDLHAKLDTKAPILEKILAVLVSIDETLGRIEDSIFAAKVSGNEKTPLDSSS